VATSDPPQGRDYPRFRQIDGRHPLRRAVPCGYIDYAARRRRDGAVAYFNFALAEEMGLIPENHPRRLDAGLRRAILDTFCLVIINEYDLKRDVRVAERDRLPYRYMATRYLQLQHPDRLGLTSGDGRSIWNGTVTHRGTTWDITSCGTGVTRLCPATAETQRHFKTGSRSASYGCGTASLEEGLVTALMSETFHRNGLTTERVLAVIALPDGVAINVRAGRNLLRPSHFFLHLKQGNLEGLRGAIDLFIDRQTSNGDFPRLRGAPRRYSHLAEEMARTFARIAATFESEYIFCWLDWDGDNILADGGIIDYGSVRQFGLYHREYRFDDGPRWSTTIPEQRRMARLIVQNFAQVRDYLIKGEKRALRDFARDSVLDLFDAHFASTKRNLLLRNIGYRAPIAERLASEAPAELRRFQRAHAYFERARSVRGPREVEDGLTWNAIFSTRDLLRELPARMLLSGGALHPDEILEIALSSYASREDRRPTPHRRRMALELQQAWMALAERAAAIVGQSVPLLLTEIAGRSTVINRYDRITGDAALYAAQRLIRHRKRLSSQNLHRVIERFVELQILIPELKPHGSLEPSDHPDVKRVLDRLLEPLAEMRHGL
jgi:hypothetical protein